MDEVELDSCGDVVELKIDVQPPTSLKDIVKLVALVRRKIDVPLMVDVDNEFKKTISEQLYFDFLQYALRLGVEYIVVDLRCRFERIRQPIKSKGRTKVVGDYFDTRQRRPNAWSDGFLLEQYMKGERLGCDLVRISRVAAKVDSNDDLLSFRKNVESLSRFTSQPTLIAYNLGPCGHLSQVSNQTVSSSILCYAL